MGEKKRYRSASDYVVGLLRVTEMVLGIVEKYDPPLYRAYVLDGGSPRAEFDFVLSSRRPLSELAQAAWETQEQLKSFDSAHVRRDKGAELERQFRSYYHHEDHPETPRPETPLVHELFAISDDFNTRFFTALQDVHDSVNPKEYQILKKELMHEIYWLRRAEVSALTFPFMLALGTGGAAALFHVCGADNALGWAVGCAVANYIWSRICGFNPHSPEGWDTFLDRDPASGVGPIGLPSYAFAVVGGVVLSPLLDRLMDSLHFQRTPFAYGIVRFQDKLERLDDEIRQRGEAANDPGDAGQSWAGDMLRQQKEAARSVKRRG